MSTEILRNPPVSDKCVGGYNCVGGFLVMSLSDLDVKRLTDADGLNYWITQLSSGAMMRE